MSYKCILGDNVYVFKRQSDGKIGFLAGSVTAVAQRVPIFRNSEFLQSYSVLPAEMPQCVPCFISRPWCVLGHDVEVIRST